MRAASLAAPFLTLAMLACGSGEREPLAPTAPPERLSAGDPASGPSANGHSNWINLAGEYVSRSFVAREHDGVVTGNFVQHVTAVNGVKRVNKGDINCLRILGPNEAVLSGPVRENANPALIGAIQIFRIVDNGEGSTDAPDMQSALIFRDPAVGVDCSNFNPPVVTPILAGNLQVRP
jgi:hypothetical protein